MSADLKQLLGQLRAQGLTITRPASGHVKVCRNGRVICSMSSTPSDRFALIKIKADLKRAGVEL